MTTYLLFFVNYVFYAFATALLVSNFNCVLQKLPALKNNEENICKQQRQFSSLDQMFLVHLPFYNLHPRDQ